MEILGLFRSVSQLVEEQVLREVLNLLLLLDPLNTLHTIHQRELLLNEANRTVFLGCFPDLRFEAWLYLSHLLVLLCQLLIK